MIIEFTDSKFSSLNYFNHWFTRAYHKKELINYQLAHSYLYCNYYFSNHNSHNQFHFINFDQSLADSFTSIDLQFYLQLNLHLGFC